MKITYQGKTTTYKNRCAEIWLDEATEAKTMDKMIPVLNIKGWQVDYSVEGYASCQVASKSEYELFKKDYLQVKKSVKLWQKYGI